MASRLSLNPLTNSLFH